jgi:uncharacterized protein (TIGR02594 family)
LNVRKSPSLDSEVINSLHKGDVVELTEKLTGDYWYKVKTENVEGWASHKWLELVIANVQLTEQFPWMPIALAEIGTKEIVGEGNNPRVLSYLSTTTLDISAADRATDETAWCSAFVNWCVEKAGFEGTDKASADSWLNWGNKISTPRRGCITVFTRAGGNHVAFYIGETADEIEVLGGNQSNAVNIGKRLKSDLLGYRIPATSPQSQLFDYSALTFLSSLTRDKNLTAEQSKNFYNNGIVPLCDNKELFNKARSEGYAEVTWAQSAPCATTTSAVLESAFRLAGMPVQAEIFNDHSKFGPTHNVERMLYRLGFNYWLKSKFKSQKGAIGLMAGRYEFHGTPKHSGHIYTIFSEIDAKYDMIGDNGGYNHPYRGEGWEIGTEGFWLPSGIEPQRR